jgi:hypothetical protein
MNSRNDWDQRVAREISHGIAKRIAMGIAFFLTFLVFIAVGGVVVQMLWNWLLPDILNLRRITLWEALGVLALSRILFGGFGRGGGSRMRRRRGRQCDDRWRQSRTPRAGEPAAAAATPE